MRMVARFVSGLFWTACLVAGLALGFSGARISLAHLAIVAVFAAILGTVTAALDQPSSRLGDLGYLAPSFGVFLFFAGGSENLTQFLNACAFLFLGGVELLGRFLGKRVGG